MKLSDIIKKRFLENNSKTKSKMNDCVISRKLFENNLVSLNLYDAFNMWLETHSIKHQNEYLCCETISRSNWLIHQLGRDFGFSSNQLDQLFK